MKTIKLRSSTGQDISIPIAATKLSEVLRAEFECHDGGNESNENDFEGNDSNGGKVKVLLTASRVSSSTLTKVADFMTYYVTVEEMKPFEPPFESENIYDIVQKWYADFITVNIDRALLFDTMSAANFLGIQPLLKLAVLAISINMNGKSPDEIRPMFGITNDLDKPEEKYRVRGENAWTSSKEVRLLLPLNDS